MGSPLRQPYFNVRHSKGRAHSESKMFRKPKQTAKNTKAGLRRKRSQEDDDASGSSHDDTREANIGSERKSAPLSNGKRIKQTNVKNKGALDSTDSNENEASASISSKGLLHQYELSLEQPATQKELATRTNEHHPTTVVDRNNKFLAGPIKAPTNIRTTCRFDYQPDICKDYKDTGFCGFGDTCIYLHDRGDFLSGWQLEQRWQQQQEKKKQQQKEAIDAFIVTAGRGGAAASLSTESGVETSTTADDGLPFACHICRGYFKDPVVTNCSHYFCQGCLLEYVQSISSLCPICSKETHGVFHEPVKLLSKKRRVCGRDSTWKEFYDALQLIK